MNQRLAQMPAWNFLRKPMPYDSFMESEGVPVYRWHRGAPRAGSADGAVEAPWWERQLYPALRHRRAVGHVCGRDTGCRRAQHRATSLREGRARVEGRGTTEVWQEGQTKRPTFEWQKGSLFSVPPQCDARFINAGSAPALLLCGTSAPNVMNLIDNPNFIFNCSLCLQRAVLWC